MAEVVGWLKTRGNGPDNGPNNDYNFIPIGKSKRAFGDGCKQGTRWVMGLLTVQDACKLSAKELPVNVHKIDDGSVLIEWIAESFRIGFSIEPDFEESSWYVVDNKDLTEGGYIFSEKARSILKKLLKNIVQVQRPIL